MRERDTLQALLLDAGVKAAANLRHIEIYIQREGEASLPQKIDLNRAEPWLLEALPGIEEVRARLSWIITMKMVPLGELKTCFESKASARELLTE